MQLPSNMPYINDHSNNNTLFGPFTSYITPMPDQLLADHRNAHRSPLNPPKRHSSFDRFSHKFLVYRGKSDKTHWEMVEFGRKHNGWVVVDQKINRNYRGSCGVARSQSTIYRMLGIKWTQNICAPQLLGAGRLVLCVLCICFMTGFRAYIYNLVNGGIYSTMCLVVQFGCSQPAVPAYLFTNRALGRLG